MAKKKLQAKTPMHDTTSEAEEPILEEHDLETIDEDPALDSAADDILPEEETKDDTASLEEAESPEEEAQIAPMPAVLKCHKCGEEVVVEDPVCPVCGTKLRILDHLKDFEDEAVVDEVYPLDPDDDVLPKSASNKLDDDIYSGLTYSRDPYE